MKLMLCLYLRNEFDFWNVHGIMNTLGLLKSEREALASSSLCKRPKASMIPCTDQKLNLLRIIACYNKYLKYRNYLYFMKRNSFFFIYVIVLTFLLKCEAEQPVSTRTANNINKSLVCTCDSGVVRCQLQHQCHFWRKIFDRPLKSFAKRTNQLHFLE